MKVVAISDTHTFHDQAVIPECDILIHAGDFSHFGDTKVVSSFTNWLRKVPAKHVIVTAGNHDVFIQESEQKYRYAFPVGCHFLLHEEAVVEGIKIFASPWTPWFHEWAYNFPKDDPDFARKAWSLIPDDTEILITHGPPAGILDGSKRDARLGCPALRERIRQLPNLRLHIFGHIHEGYGMHEEDGVTFLNASFVDANRKPVNKPWVIEW